MDWIELIRNIGQPIAWADIWGPSAWGPECGGPSSVRSGHERSRFWIRFGEMARADCVKLLEAIDKPLTSTGCGTFSTCTSAGCRRRAWHQFSVGEILDVLRLGQFDFDAFFSAQVRLSTGHVAGAEALARGTTRSLDWSFDRLRPPWNGVRRSRN